MIRVLCLNPVIDRMYSIPSFQPGIQFKEVQPAMYAGGKGVNVARVLNKLGVPCILYLFTGGDNGNYIQRQLEAENIRMRLFPVDGETRVTINIIDPENRKETEITEPGPSVTESGVLSFTNMLNADLTPEDTVICSGIPLPGMPMNIYQRISGLCMEKNCKCVLDVNSGYLKASFPGNYYLVKPNFNELQSFCGTSLPLSERNILDLGREMMEAGAHMLLVSTGASGAVLMTDNACWRAIVPKPEKIISTIGSGDASVAGFCCGLSGNLTLPESLKLSMACGVVNTQYEGVGQITMEAVREMQKSIRIEQIA